MTPGLDCEDIIALDGLNRTDNWVQYLLNLPMSSKPGKKWNYCSGTSHLASAILQKETEMDARSYANQYLFAPLGISQVTEQDWASDPQEITNGIAGLYLTPRELAKYSYLYLSKGHWNGEQIMSAQWVTLKQNAALGKAPVRRVVTQNNHVFAALYAFFKLECLKIKRHLHHFALRAHLYLKAIRVAFDELQVLKAA